jgi:hypothetical protein
MTTERTSIIIPTSPADLKDIFLVVRQISDSKTRAQAEGDYQKEAIKELAEKYNLEAKHIRQMVNDYHKQQFDKKADEFEEYSALYEKVMTQGAKAAQGIVSSDEEE